MTDLNALVDRYNTLIDRLRTEAQRAMQRIDRSKSTISELRRLCESGSAPALLTFLAYSDDVTSYVEQSNALAAKTKTHVAFFESLIMRNTAVRRRHAERLATTLGVLESVITDYRAANTRLEARTTASLEQIRAAASD